MSQLKKAACQLNGAISYAVDSGHLDVTVEGMSHRVPVADREIVGLIVVRELFDDEFSSYSPVLLDLFDRTGIRCFTLDYPELHQYTFFLRTEEDLVDALDQVFEVARENRFFPRLRLGLVQPSDDA